MSRLETDFPGVSIVIPAWNEEGRLTRTLERYLPPLEASGGPFEVIVVADGGGDRTAEVSAKFADRNVRVLRFPSRLGKGGAVAAGLKTAQHAWVGFVDADGPVPPEDVLRLAATLRDFDCAIASRAVPGSIATVSRTLSRRLLSRVWNLAVRGVLLLPIKDTQCGAKFFRASSIASILPKVAVTNWAFDISMLFHIRESGRSIREVPVTWTEGGGSKLVIHKDVPMMFLALIGIRLMNSRVGRYVPRRSSS